MGKKKKLSTTDTYDKQNVAVNWSLSVMGICFGVKSNYATYYD